MMFKSYSFDVILNFSVWAAGCVQNEPPNKLIQVDNIGYKWFDNYVGRFGALHACLEDGGYVVGNEKDFSQIMNTRSELKNFLPTDKCYWIGDITDDGSLENYFLRVMFRKQMCHSADHWHEKLVVMLARGYYVCEYDRRSFSEIPPAQPVEKRRITRRVGDSTIIMDRPLFSVVAPVPTMCSRLCQRLSGCSAFNYNTETGECRGFHPGEGRLTTCQHVDWEYWVIEY